MHGRVPFSLVSDTLHPVLHQSLLRDDSHHLVLISVASCLRRDSRSWISPALCCSPSVALQGKTEQLHGVRKISFLAHLRIECWVKELGCV